MEGLALGVRGDAERFGGGVEAERVGTVGFPSVCVGVLLEKERSDEFGGALLGFPA